MCRHITTTSRGELRGLERSENKVVLSLDLKAEMGGGGLFMSCSNWFHKRGAAAAKALSPFCLKHDLGMCKRSLPVGSERSGSWMWTNGIVDVSWGLPIIRALKLTLSLESFPVTGVEPACPTAPSEWVSIERPHVNPKPGVSPL